MYVITFMIPWFLGRGTGQGASWVEKCFDYSGRVNELVWMDLGVKVRHFQMI